MVGCLRATWYGFSYGGTTVVEQRAWRLKKKEGAKRSITVRCHFWLKFFFRWPETARRLLCSPLPCCARDRRSRDAIRLVLVALVVFVTTTHVFSTDDVYTAPLNIDP